jgi:hypothetical protein
MDSLELQLTIVDIVIGLAIAIFTLIVSSFVSFFLARRYGDLAGTKAAIEFEKEKAKQARITTLQSLLNEVLRVRDLAACNFTLEPNGKKIQGVVRMPVIAFETAFLSGETSLSVKRIVDLEGKPASVETPGLYTVAEPLASVTAYLKEAYSINALVDIYFGLVRGLSSEEESRRAEVINQIINKSRALHDKTLNRLEKVLERELEGKRQSDIVDVIE